MQLQRNNIPKNKINESVHRFHNYNENTMQAVVQSSVSVAVLQIYNEFKNKLDKKPLETLADAMIEHHIIDTKEKSAFILELQGICDRQQKEGINGTVNILSKNISLSLKDIICLLIRAIREQNYFTQTIYKERLQQFKFCMESMRDGKACNTGRRNQFCAALLHLDYKNPEAKDKIYIISALAGDMRDMALAYYAEQFNDLQKSDAKQAFKLMKFWVSLSKNQLKKNKHAEKEILQFINSYRESLEKHLYQRLDLLGIQPETPYTKELPKVRDAVNFLLNNLDELDCPTLGSDQMMYEFTKSMETIHGYRKKQINNESTSTENTAIGEFDKLQNFEEFQQSQPILQKRLLSFQETAIRYKNKFAFGEKWGNAITLAQKLYKQTDTFLKQTTIPYNHFINLEKMYNQFQEKLLIAASDKTELRELIDNSIVYHTLELPEKDQDHLKARLLERIKELKQDIIFSDKELERLLQNNIENENECHLELFDINRILWQALLTNPTEWSSYFYGTLKQVCELLQNASDVNVQNIKKNLPPSLTAQINFLMQIHEISANKQRVEKTVQNIKTNLTLPYSENLQEEINLAVTEYEIKANEKNQITIPSIPMFIAVEWEVMNIAIYRSDSATAMCRALIYIHPHQRLIALRRINFLVQERKLVIPFNTVLKSLKLIAALQELKTWLPYLHGEHAGMFKSLLECFERDQYQLCIDELKHSVDTAIIMYGLLPNKLTFFLKKSISLDVKEFRNIKQYFEHIGLETQLDIFNSLLKKIKLDYWEGFLLCHQLFEKEDKRFRAMSYLVKNSRPSYAEAIKSIEMFYEYKAIRGFHDFPVTQLLELLKDYLIVEKNDFHKFFEDFYFYWKDFECGADMLGEAIKEFKDKIIQVEGIQAINFNVFIFDTMWDYLISRTDLKKNEVLLNHMKMFSRINPDLNKLFLEKLSKNKANLMEIPVQNKFVRLAIVSEFYYYTSARPEVMSFLEQFIVTKDDLIEMIRHLDTYHFHLKITIADKYKHLVSSAFDLFELIISKDVRENPRLSKSYYSDERTCEIFDKKLLEPLKYLIKESKFDFDSKKMLDYMNRSKNEEDILFILKLFKGNIIELAPGEKGSLLFDIASIYTSKWWISYCLRQYFYKALCREIESIVDNEEIFVAVIKAFYKDDLYIKAPVYLEYERRIKPLCDFFIGDYSCYVPRKAIKHHNDAEKILSAFSKELKYGAILKFRLYLYFDTEKLIQIIGGKPLNSTMKPVYALNALYKRISYLEESTSILTVYEQLAKFTSKAALTMLSFFREFKTSEGAGSYEVSLLLKLCKMRFLSEFCNSKLNDKKLGYRPYKYEKEIFEKILKHKRVVYLGSKTLSSQNTTSFQLYKLIEKDPEKAEQSIKEELKILEKEFDKLFNKGLEEDKQIGPSNNNVIHLN